MTTTTTCANHTLVPATHTIPLGHARRPTVVPLCGPCAERASEPATAIPDATDTITVPRGELRAVLDRIDELGVLFTPPEMESLVALHDALAVRPNCERCGLPPSEHDHGVFCR